MQKIVGILYKNLYLEMDVNEDSDGYKCTYGHGLKGAKNER